jgi:hypothetical protein
MSRSPFTAKTLTFTDSALKTFTEPFILTRKDHFSETYTGDVGDVVHYHGAKLEMLSILMSLNPLRVSLASEKE